MAEDTQLRGGSVSRGLALLVAGAMFMEILDGTVIAPAAPHIGESFGVPAVSVNVAITAYVLAVAALLPNSGVPPARFGTRGLFSWSSTSQSPASTLCAAAPRLPWLV